MSTTDPRCPRCNSKGEKCNPEGTIWRCKKCRGFYDTDPAEGSDYSDRNPAARLERKERKPPC